MLDFTAFQSESKGITGKLCTQQNWQCPHSTW